MMRQRVAVTHAQDTSDIQRTPWYFGAPARPLFGWYHAPANGAPIVGATVICPPLGHEYMSAHRTLRHLADRLAIAGIAALRFDYDGTGDSAGSEYEPHQLARWIASVHDAVATLRHETGCHVGLAGLRMGATLAALAAREVECSNLVLWAPCLRGRTFVRELKALAGAGVSGPAAHAGGAFEAAGFVVSTELQQDLSAVDLGTAPPRTRRVLVGRRDDMVAAAESLPSWSNAGIEVDEEVLPGYADVMVPPHHTRVPQAAIDYVVGWLATAAVDGALPAEPTTRGTPIIGLARAVEFEGIRESTLHYGAENRGFAILTEPAHPVPGTLPAVVLSNSGSSHHVGPNRLYVNLARTLGLAGFRCLRVDLPGLGDTVVDDPVRENVSYPPDAPAAIRDAADALAGRTGADSFVIAGLCSGAHTAFHAALDLAECPIVEAMLFNPLTFDYRPGMPLDVSSDPHATRWQRYRRSIGSVQGWSKLFRRDIGVGTIVDDVIERMVHTVKAAVAGVRVRVFRAADPRERTPLAVRIRQLSACDRRLTCVFSKFDPGYDLLMREAGTTVRRLRREGRMAIRVIDGANHTFDARLARDRMIREVVDLLSERYRPGGVTAAVTGGTGADTREAHS